MGAPLLIAAAAEEQKASDAGNSKQAAEGGCCCSDVGGGGLEGGDDVVAAVAPSGMYGRDWDCCKERFDDYFEGALKAIAICGKACARARQDRMDDILTTRCACFWRCRSITEITICWETWPERSTGFDCYGRWPCGSTGPNTIREGHSQKRRQPLVSTELTQLTLPLLRIWPVVLVKSCAILLRSLTC